MRDRRLFTKVNHGLTALLLGFAVCLAAGPAAGEVIVLQDGNAEVQVELAGDTGMFNWTVDGVDHLKQQWFWYRVGADGPEMPVSSLAFDGKNVGDDRLVVRYAGVGFTITLDFVLHGGQAGSGASDIVEVITFDNTGGADLDFHFFQYADFDLDGDPTDSKAVIVGGNTAQQSDKSIISETVVTQMPTYHKAAPFNSIIALLGDAKADALAPSAPGPVVDDDLTWAFQWDFTLSDTYIISKNKNLVPEPTALSVLLLGCAAVLRRKGRQ